MKYFVCIILICTLFGCQEQKKENPEVTTLQKAENKTKITEQDSMKKVNEPEKEKWLSEARLWEMYNEARSKVKAAEKKENFEEMSKYSYEAAIYANALERKDIEAWQYNNAAFYLINAFQNKTGYHNEMDQLNKLELKTEILEFREQMKKKFRKEQRLLSKAEGFLEKAKEIDDELEESERTKIISNNQSFVSDVLNLTGDN